ncbi:hypothetical protein BDZ89DRAFT_1079086 [Hymenopellis radicata]|nr:hypothetical protein BDZ89DRAFT_1079086 [Hymenopellis radicata]
MNGAADFDIDGLLDTVFLPFRTISNEFQMTASVPRWASFTIRVIPLVPILISVLRVVVRVFAVCPLCDTPISLMFVSPFTHACLALPKS